jgi:hypothetical protein
VDVRYQQNLKNFNIAIVLLVARSNRLRLLMPLVPEISNTLDNMKAGDFVELAVAR